MNEFYWEDYLLERKTENDLKDLLKTLVAFANSVRPEHKAVILIGERDDGTAQGIKNLDNVQKAIRREAEKIYPAIIWRSEVYEKDEKYCIRVEVEYSGETPHFGGIAWVRKGSETVKASDEVFQKLIDLRSNKVRELFKWVGKEVTISADNSDRKKYQSAKTITTLLVNPPDWFFSESVKLIFVNQFWITIESDNSIYSYSMEKISLSFNNDIGQLLITVKE